MPITLASQVPQFDLDGFHFLGFTSPSRGSTELCTWQLDIDPGAASDPHKLNHEEVFILLQGTLSVVLDEEEIQLNAGDALAVPTNCLLQIINNSYETARAIVCITAGFKAMHPDGREIGTPPWAL